MPAPDALLARYGSELEERAAFQAQIAAGAEEAGRDMTAEELELYNRATTRMAALEAQMGPLREGARIATESRARMAQLTTSYTEARTGSPSGGPAVEYRSAGAYLRDHCRAIANRDLDAAGRLDVYNRAAAHQTTADNPGLLPEQLLAPILANMDLGRPIVSAIGPQQLPAGSWSRPRVTQHTQVAKQTAEKTELASRKMIITKIPLDGDTFGGYVNVSRQNIDWTQPQVLDIVIGDLTNEYSFETESEAGDILVAGAATGPTIPATPTAADVAKALWGAAGQAGAAMWAARMPLGQLTIAMSFDMLGLVGPLFAPVNPQNAQSTGFNAGAFGEGAQPAISGITPVVSGALPAGTAIVFGSNAVEAYEDRIGALQVVEPSVLGVQVAYAGYFTLVVLEPTGVVKITTA